MDELELKVAEAMQIDYGKRVVRLDSNARRLLNLTTGDVIQIAGKKITAALVLPAHPQDEGLNIIRMDGILRQNTNVALGDRVKVKKAEIRTAKKIVLAPNQNSRYAPGFDTYVKKNLIGKPLSKGDILSVNIFGTSFPFVVAQTVPNGLLLVAPETEVILKEEPVKELGKVSTIAYEDIGGLKDEVQKIREMIELPMRHPELFERLGIEPPKGVLIYGPPGTGKTLLARAVASESDAHFITINGPEIVSKFVGEAEERLRGIFQEAEENAPTIIFIDEIDAIAPKREEVVGEVEKRIVSQMLTLMDGLKSRGQVVVIGATNRQNSIDPALRRPGRFDREIEIGVPDKKGRKEILQIHTRGMPLNKDISLDEIAGQTHGFVGADLHALVKEGAMKALRRMLPKIDLEAEQIPAKILEELKVTRDDVQNALREIQPSALREVYVEVPNVKWSDIGGLEPVKREIREAVEMPLKKPEVFKRMGIRPVRGILLYGPPGTGKTLLAKAVATESEANFISIKGPELLSKWVGESLGYDEEVIIQIDGVMQRRRIGELVDENLNQNARQLNVLKQRVLIQTFNEEGKVQWAPITDFIRHTAPTQLYEVHTRSGRRVQLTADHGLFVLDEGMIKTVPTRNLVPGESFVAIPRQTPTMDKNVTLDLLELFADDAHITVGNVSSMVQEAIGRFGREKVNRVLGYSRPWDVLQRVKGDMRIPMPAFEQLVKMGAAYEPTQLTIGAKGQDRLPAILTVTPELAYWIGIWVAEGDYNGRGARVHNQNPENRQRLKTALEAVGIAYSEHRTAIVTSSLSAKILRVLGLNHGADQKRLPAIAFSLRQDVLAAMLSGYFSGDGSVYGNAHRSYVEACTASQGLANDLMRLLLRFGIVAMHYERTDKRYGTLMHKVQFSGVENFQKFASIGFSDTKRNERVAAYIISKKWTRTAQLPIDKTLLELLQQYGFSEWSKSKTVGRRILLELFRKAPEKETAAYRMLLESDLQWDLVADVRKVQYDKPYVYDVSVDSTQRFMAGFGGLYVHNSEKSVREIFRKARQAAPTVIFIDELDSIAQIRGSDEGSGVGARVVDSLLTEMDGLKNVKDVVVIGATNRIDIIDPALLRPGRFDKLIEIEAPDAETRVAILKVHTAPMPIGPKVDLAKLAAMTEGFSGADLEGLCREAAMIALRENLAAKLVEPAHFEKALASLSPVLMKKREREKDLQYA